MHLRIARTIYVIVLMLMCLEIIGASATAGMSASCQGISIAAAEERTSIPGAFLFEKAEEENDKTEEENCHIARTLLIDFSHVAHSLSACYLGVLHLPANTTLFNVRPPAYRLNRVLLL